jgi:carbon starvation protein
MDDMHTVVTNATVDGVLSVLFAVLILIVLADAARTCLKAVADPGSVRLSEVPWTESRIVAPAGLIATAEEKAELAAAGLDGGGGRVKEPAAS